MSNDPSNSNLSTTSLQSDTTVTSTSPLNNIKPPQKDYSLAFATLQSRYGTGGNIPTPKPDKSKESARPTSTSDTTLTADPPHDSVSAKKTDSKNKSLFQALKENVRKDKKNET